MQTIQRRGRPGEAMVIRSKVAGVTATNPDGLERQEIIRRGCRAGMSLIAVPEPNNPHAPHAIGLWIERNGKRWQIGYIRSGLAAELCEYLDEGAYLKVQILQVTGGDAGRSFGVNIRIYVAVLIDVAVLEDEIDDEDDDDEKERPVRRGRRRSTVTVEATGKGWKAIQGIGCLGVLGGIVLIGIASSTIDPAAKGPSPIGGIGAMCFLLGLPVYLFGRIGAWWFHG
jgi:hypothetical protein